MVRNVIVLEPARASTGVGVRQRKVFMILLFGFLLRDFEMLRNDKFFLSQDFSLSFCCYFWPRLRVRVTWEIKSVVAGKVSCKKLVFCFRREIIRQCTDQRRHGQRQAGTDIVWLARSSSKNG